MAMNSVELINVLQHLLVTSCMENKNLGCGHVHVRSISHVHVDGILHVSKILRKKSHGISSLIRQKTETETEMLIE